MLNMNNPVSKDTLIGKEWMALRQIALGAKAAAIPRTFPISCAWMVDIKSA